MKKIWFTGLFLYLLTAVTGCAAADENQGEMESGYIYYMNAEESKVIQRDYALENSDTRDSIEKLCEIIREQPVDTQFIALLPADVFVEDWELQDGVLWLDFNKGYYDLEKSREILTRAGIARTFSQFTEVKYIGFKVKGNKLTNSKDEDIGLVNQDSFVENSGKDINEYQYVKMKLYFTNKSGDELVQEERNVYYSKNTPLERAVIEQLLKGPENSQNAPVIPAETKILGASAVDGIGYVNLDKAFQDMALPIQEDIAIQSITNSLADTCGVSKVQISINGESKIQFRESISLDQLFEPDRSLVEEKTYD